MEYALINGTWAVKDYDQVIENCRKWVSDQLSLLPESITDPAELKAIKGLRADNNKQRDAIKDLRIKVNEQILGTFNSQAKEIEAELAKLESECKRLVDGYKKAQEEAKKAEAPEAPKSLCLRIYSLNKDVLDKVKAYAEKQGCTCDVL